MPALRSARGPATQSVSWPSRKVRLHPIIERLRIDLRKRHALKVVFHFVFNRDELIQQHARLLIVQDQVNTPMCLQAVNRHHVGWYAGVPHFAAHSHHRIDVLMGGLDARVGIAGHIRQCFQGIFGQLVCNFLYWIKRSQSPFEWRD